MDTNYLKKKLEQLICAQQEEAEQQKARYSTYMNEFQKLNNLLETSLLKMNTQDDPETRQEPTLGKRKHGDSPSSNIKKCKNDVNDYYSDMETKSRNMIEQICNKLESWSCTGEERINFFKKIKEKILDLKNRDIHEEKVFIGIFGMTGTGKSSLINALLNEFGLLPTSPVEACTSCIVQVQTHENNNFRGEIEYLSKEEWENELMELLENYKKDYNDQDSDERNKGEDSESFNAKEKITAIYGSDGPTKGFSELVRKDIHKSLEHNFSSKLASDLCKKMKSYISSDSDVDSSCSYWPLVKVVKIFVPKKTCSLPDKVVLVDLPGTGDTNKERNDMWKEYITKCSYIWIVADITRAQSNRNVLEILNTGLDGIAGGGRCQNIDIICTKTDVTGIESNEMSKDAGSEDERKEITKRNKEAKMKLIDKYDNQVKTFLMGSSGECDVSNKIKVFTVSSKEYWNVKREKKNILTIEDTEVPSLQEYLKEIDIIQKRKAVENYISEVSGIISFLNVPKEMAEDKANENLSLYEELKSNLSPQIKDLEFSLDQIQTTLQTKLQSGAQEAVNNCQDILDSILNPNTNLSGYHQTLKALCRNHGSFHSSTWGFIDLNKKLASPIYAAVNNTIKSTFQFDVDTTSNIKGKLSLLQSNFLKALKSKKTAQSYRMIFIKTELRRELVCLENEILLRKIIIYNTIIKSIQEKLDPVYKVASKQHGRKSMKKIQTMFKKKVDEYQSSMFNEATEKMLVEFDELKRHVITTIEGKMETSMKLALKQFPEGLILPDSSKELEMMKELCEELRLNIFN
ncbi:nuclear GTPase SLIP-GC-like isoform X2 [Erpetoichthys calabaricus]|uniref:Nuclear GTPase SLIP-GC-like n=1 Tax=Erpetoichthys calabaricus TaxID=27687 RepID=A0A8C4SYD1_ERPCA|nr:nuclear GTPase SLIP-GC-like isoform X2 [Erpetoichthys calabaricus]